MLGKVIFGLLGISLWLILASGRLDSLVVGVPVVGVAIVVGRWLLPATMRRLDPVAAIGFAGAFALGCTKGGVDVARRVLRRRLDFAPGTLTMRPRLPAGLGLQVLVHAINLQPGTVCILDDDGQMQLWVLDCRQDHSAELRALEARIAVVFGYELPDVGGAAA